jgi:hypothetical protein
MSKQDKGSLCACGCKTRKPNRKRRFAPGHDQNPRNNTRSLRHALAGYRDVVKR